MFFKRKVNKSDTEHKEYINKLVTYLLSNISLDIYLELTGIDKINNFCKTYLINNPYKLYKYVYRVDLTDNIMQKWLDFFICRQKILNKSNILEMNCEDAYLIVGTDDDIYDLFQFVNKKQIKLLNPDITIINEDQVSEEYKLYKSIAEFVSFTLENIINELARKINYLNIINYHYKKYLEGNRDIFNYYYRIKLNTKPDIISKFEPIIVHMPKWEDIYLTEVNLEDNYIVIASNKELNSIDLIEYFNVDFSSIEPIRKCKK